MTLKKIASAYYDTFTSDSGEQVLDDLRKAYGERLSHVKGDPYETARREGNREVYIRILNFMSEHKSPRKEEAEDE